MPGREFRLKAPGGVVRFGAIAAGLAVSTWIGGLVLPRGLPFGVVVQGVVIGGLGAFTAMGLVLVYRAARFVNFAQAAMGGLGASAALVAMTGWGLPYAVAVPIGLAVAIACGLAMDLAASRLFAGAPRLTLTVMSVAALLVLGAAEEALPLLTTKLRLATGFTAPFTSSVRIGPILFDANDLIAVVVVVAASFGLWWFLARTEIGTAVRAVADSPERARLLGIPVRRIARVVWILAGLLSGLGAVLAEPILHTSAGIPSTPADLLPALAAFALAGFDSFPGAAGWAIAIGIMQQAVFWSYQRSSSADVALFALVAIGLGLRRWRGSRSDGRRANAFSNPDPQGEHLASAETRPIPVALARLPAVRIGRAGLLACVVIAAALLPLGFDQSQTDLLTAIPIYAVVAVSMVVLTGWAGQVSLGQFAFAGVGAVVTSVMLVHAHADFFASIALSALAGAVVACLVGWPALRLPGLSLAAVTLAFAVPVSTWLLSSDYFPALNPDHVSRPVLFGRFPTSPSAPTAFYELCLAVLVLCALVARNLRRSRAGRAIVAARDCPDAACAYGIDPVRSKLLAFCLSGAIAAIAGGLYVVELEGLGSGGLQPEMSVTVFVMAVIGGLGSVTGAVLGAAYYEAVTHFLSLGWQLLALGGGLLVVLRLLPEGLAGLLTCLRDLALAPIARRYGIGLVSTDPSDMADATRAGGPKADASGHEAFEDSGSVLCVRDLKVRIGGCLILDGVDFGIKPGEVLALLGTNGAGKSTTLRAVAGVLPAEKGEMILEGVDVSCWPPERRVEAGIVVVFGGRCVFSSLTVEENLRMARWIARRRGDYQGLEDARAKVARLFPRLAERSLVKAGFLSGGEQQMLGIAQGLMCAPKLLLIDELSLGLAPAVVAELLDVVRSLAQQGVSVVVVEQSMNVATSLASRAVFLERGTVGFSGPIEELAGRSDLLRSVFLGEAVGSGVVVSKRAPAVARGTQDCFALEVVEVAKQFGGVSALNGASLSVSPGEILGVIGANGAGKTTLLDVCSGFALADRGRVMLHGHDVTELRAWQRARRGLGRLFQDARLWPALTVTEAVCTALDRHVKVRDPFLALWWTLDVAASEEEVAESANELVKRFGLSRYADNFVSELSTGTRRLVELACLVAHEPSVLLLDEPTSGVAQKEAEAMAPLLVDLRDETGAAMVVIEHDVGLVASLADRLVCLDLGEVIAEGPPYKVLADPAVLSAYLGEPEALTARSGPLG